MAYNHHGQIWRGTKRGRLEGEGWVTGEDTGGNNCEMNTLPATNESVQWMSVASRLMEIDFYRARAFVERRGKLNRMKAIPPWPLLRTHNSQTLKWTIYRVLNRKCMMNWLGIGLGAARGMTNTTSSMRERSKYLRARRPRELARCTDKGQCQWDKGQAKWDYSRLNLGRYKQRR